MKKKCLFNLHAWVGCKCSHCGQTRDESHDWDGCKCSRCGQTRDESHNWDGCKCSRCSQTRDESHDWDGCVCKKCGFKRDEGHDWVRVTLGEVCGCGGCPQRAGPGDWGMCMPETGGSCMGQGRTCYDETNRCKRCGAVQDEI